MKKHFIFLSAFAALLLSAILLTSCGEDVQVPEKVGTESEISRETNASTIFSTGGDNTRTSMDADRKFYWSEGDQIYVNIEGNQCDPRLILKDEDDEFSEVVFTKQWAELRLVQHSQNLATDYSGVEVELSEVPENDGNLSFRVYEANSNSSNYSNYHNVTSQTNTLNFSEVTQDPIQLVTIVWRTGGIASLKIRHVYLIKKDGTKEEVTPNSRNACTITPVFISGAAGSTGPQYVKTTSSRLYENDKKADFELLRVQMTAPKCSLVYIGNGTTAPTLRASLLKVKIEDKQTQSDWGDSKHLGASGDCGAAEATKGGGKYNFKLTHKAAYLVFQPYKGTVITDNWKLMKIEIISDGTTTLAGEYPFATGELDVSGATNTANVVTLLCNGNGSNTGGFTLGTSASAANSCFAVIQPGHHKLTIRYTIQPTGSVNYYGSTFTIDKKIALRAYNPNGVTTVKHELGVMLFDNVNYYCPWDGNPVVQGDIVPDDFGYNRTVTWPKNASEIAVQSAQNSCKDMPNVNEAYWYIENGDPHWDGTFWWTADGGKNVCSGGVWLKKKQTILDEGKTFRDNIGKDGVDMRLTFKEHSRKMSLEVLPVSERSKYFFLPAQGLLESGFSTYKQYRDNLFSGAYWLSSPAPGLYSYSAWQWAYYLRFSCEEGGYGYMIDIHMYKREDTFVAGDWFK